MLSPRVFTVLVDVSEDNDLSEPIDIRGCPHPAIHLPTIDSATVTILGCDTVDGTYNGFYDSSGAQLTFVAGTGARWIDQDWIKRHTRGLVPFIKLAFSAQQNADRTITIVRNSE